MKVNGLEETWMVGMDNGHHLLIWLLEGREKGEGNKVK